MNSFTKTLFPLALRNLRRDARAGELGLLGLALLLAVAALTGVGLFASRVEQALTRDATQLLGGDLLLSADRPWPEDVDVRARQNGLQVVRVTQFSSMASTADQAQLVAVKAVAPGYPLRGRLELQTQPDAPARTVAGGPAPGSAWADERLAAALGLKPGDTLQVGALTLRLAGVIVYESDRSASFANFVPRLMISALDLPASGLVQEGSRVDFKLQLAGGAEAVAAFRAWMEPRLDRGQRLESLDNARPETREALDRAERFLRLAAMLSVVLAAVAIGLAARRYLQRHADDCAAMRCFGATRAQLVGLYLLEFALFGLGVSILGCLAGLGLQAGLSALARELVGGELPAPGLLPLAHGLLVGVVLMAGFVFPQILRLTRVPPLRMIRRELGSVDRVSLAAWALGVAALAGLMFWIAGDFKLGAWVVAGFGAACLLFALTAWGALTTLSRLAGRYGDWGTRYGLAALRRRLGSSLVQATALALGLLAMLLLGFVRSDLLESWRGRQPADAPNRFVLNIQPEQRDAVAGWLRANGQPDAELLPMVRGRLIKAGERVINGADYADERARNLAEREFNLSWSSRMQIGNEIVQGRWYGDSTAAEFSVEQGLMKTLGLEFGDELTFEVAGEPVRGRITSVRKLEWDSMRVNFFVVAPPALLGGYPGSYITSFYLPPTQQDLPRRLIAEFPNLSVIDVGAMIAQVRDLTERLVQVVEFVFAFALVAGAIVLWGALQSTHEERAYELAVLRTLGARNLQLRRAMLAEFALLGLVASALAVVGALGVGWALAEQVFDLPFRPQASAYLLAVLAGISAVMVLGWLGVRGLLRRPALASLREGA